MPAATRLSESIDEYLAVLRAQGCSPSTITTRRSSLLRFLAVAGNIYPRNLGPQHIDAFLIKHEHWSPATRKLNVAYLSAFQKWLHARRLMDRGTDLLEGKRRIVVPRKAKVRIKAEDFPSLLDSASSPRDRIILALGLYLMVRESELIQIRWKDVDLADGWVSIYRLKTKQADTLPMSAELHSELSRWRAYVGDVQPDWYVACSLKRGLLRNKQGRYLGNLGSEMLLPDRPLENPLRRVKAILNAAGHSGLGIGMHTLRRSGAQALLEAIERGSHDESAIRVVQAMLGHESIVRTEIYLDRDVDRTRRNDLIRGKMLYGPDLDSELASLEVLDGASADARV
jgi:integrase